MNVARSLPARRPLYERLNRLQVLLLCMALSWAFVLLAYRGLYAAFEWVASW